MRCGCQEVFSYCPSFVIPTAHMPKKYNPSAIVCLRSFLNALAVAGMKNNWRWEHLLALKLAGWKLSLTSSMNDLGKNGFCQSLWGPTSTREGLCWALCRTVFCFLLILIYSAWLELLDTAQTCFSFVPHCSSSILNKYKRALGKNIPLGCHAEQSPYLDDNDGNCRIMWDRWASKNDFAA